MENYVYVWDILAFVAGAVMAYRVVRERKRIRNPLSLIYLIIACLMMMMAVIAVIFKKYDNICALLFGVVFLIFIYRDKNKPSPGLSIEYTHLSACFACIVAIAYGIIKFFDP
ncbi:hypothetical protein [Hoylesella buccalis]|uniref:hypothetical protein n=1 Tax=Hoylesella buccalis TaxID=28127 RepID=UPI003996B671